METKMTMKNPILRGKNLKSNMQKVAKALMIPIVILPFSAIFLAIGDIAGINFLKVAGETIIQSYLPLLFAVGFAISFTGDDGYAAFAAVCGHVVMVNVMKSINPGMTLDDGTFLPNEMSVLGGIIAGIYTTILYHRFKDIKFPEFLGLFSGKRFVPIITSVVAVVFGVIFGYTWPVVNSGINSLALWVFNTGEYGVFVYGVLNRLLIPTGLHHIQQNILMHVLGSYTVDGSLITGELARFYAGDTTAGFYTGGFFALMGFALPAAALAMYHEAKTKHKKKIAGMMLTVSLTSIVVGITEPIEFMFMFTAPLLFIAHAFLTGGILTASYILGIRHYGYAMPMFFVNLGFSSRPWLIFPLGIIAAVIYYCTFRFIIRKLNYLTPGREEEIQDDKGSSRISDLALEVVSGLGGVENLEYVDACVTRLRITVFDGSKVNNDLLNKLPLMGISKLDSRNYQLIFGSKSDNLKEEINILRSVG